MLFCACVFFQLDMFMNMVFVHCIPYIHTYPHIFHLYHILRNGGLLFQFWSIGINLKEVSSNGVERKDISNQSMDNDDTLSKFDFW